MGAAFVASYAVVGLSQLGYRAVVSYEEGAACFAVVGVLRGERHPAFVDALVEVYEYAGNVEPVGARHTVFAVVAGDGGVAQQLLGGGVEEVHVLL